MLRRVFIPLAALLLLAVPCRGVEPAEAIPDFAAAVSLPQLSAYALDHNPDILTMEQRWRAAQARPSQAGSLPDPILNTAYHNEGFDRFTQGSSEFSWLRFGGEQEIPFPGKLGLKEAIAASEADRDGALYRAAVLNVLARLRVAYDDYALAHKSMEIVRDNLELLKKLAESAEARYQVGEGLQQDVARAQVEVSILTGRLTSLEQLRQSAAAMVNAVLNRPPADPLGPPTPVEKRPFAYTLDQLSALATARSPTLAATEFDVARAEKTLDLSKREFFPNFIVRADYYNKAALMPEWEVGAGIRVPLYFWRKQAFGVKEAAAGLNAARASRQAVVQDILARVKDLYAQVTSAKRLVELYGTAVVPQAQVSLSSASAGYQVGKVDFLTMLNSFTVLNEYQLRYHEELTKFDQAVARLAETAGLLSVTEDVGTGRNGDTETR